MSRFNPSFKQPGRKPGSNKGIGLPQFVDPQKGYQAVQFIVLGLTVILIGLVWEFVVVSFSARITDILRRNSWITPWLNRTMGAVFVGLGLRLASEKV